MLHNKLLLAIEVREHLINVKFSSLAFSFEFLLFGPARIYVEIAAVLRNEGFLAVFVSTRST